MPILYSSTLGTSGGGTTEFVVAVSGKTTESTLDAEYAAGDYQITSFNNSKTFTVYAYDSNGDIVGKGSFPSITTTAAFQKITIVNGKSGDAISFKQIAASVAGTTITEKIPPVITSLSTYSLANVDDTVVVYGSNFASGISAKFVGRDGTKLNAKSVSLDSSSQVTVTRPDTMPSSNQPYGVELINDGVANPDSGTHIVTSAISTTVTNYEDDIRPSEWLTMPTISDTDNKYAALLGIIPNNTNYHQFYSDVDFTVDWGDGSAVENFAGGTNATHEYDYDTISSSALDDGSKQVVMTVVPQGSGVFGDIRLQEARPSGIAYNDSTLNYQVPTLNIVEIIISAPDMTNLKLTRSNSGTTYFVLDRTRSLKVLSSSLANMSYLCYYMSNLIDLELATSETITDTQYMFAYARNISRIPSNLDFSSVTNTQYMFFETYSLRELPQSDFSSSMNANRMFCDSYSLHSLRLNVSSLQDAQYMFAKGGGTDDPEDSLTYVELTTSASLVNLSSTFSQCDNLKTIIISNASNVTTLYSTFYGCSTLSNWPFAINPGASVTNLYSAFRTCYALPEIEYFDSSSVTNWDYAFDTCKSLETMPELNFSAATSMEYIFNNCTSLKRIPDSFELGSETAPNALFRNCSSLSTVPDLDYSSVTSMTAVFAGLSVDTIPDINAGNCSIFNNLFEGSTINKTPAITTTASSVSGSYFFRYANIADLSSTIPFINKLNKLYYFAQYATLPALNIKPVNITATANNPNAIRYAFDYANIPKIHVDFSDANGNVQQDQGSGFSYVSFSANTKTSSVKLTGLNHTYSSTSTAYSFYMNSAYQLQECILDGWSTNIYVQNSAMQGPALNALYDSLKTVSSGTIYVSGSVGVNDDDPTIATAKGWTVSG